MGTQDAIQPISGKKGLAAEIQRGISFSLLCMVMLLVSASSSASNASTSTPKKSQSISTNNGTITYSASPQDVLIRTFYGGGQTGTLELRPESIIFREERDIFGAGLAMYDRRINNARRSPHLH